MLFRSMADPKPINFTRGVPATESFPAAQLTIAAENALRNHGATFCKNTVNHALSITTTESEMNLVFEEKRRIDRDRYVIPALVIRRKIRSKTLLCYDLNPDRLSSIVALTLCQSIGSSDFQDHDTL